MLNFLTCGFFIGSLKKGSLLNSSLVLNCLILTLIGFSENGNSDNNLALVNSLILGFIFFFLKMDVASISLYYCLASSLLYHWQTKIFKKLNGETFIWMDIHMCLLMIIYLYGWLFVIIDVFGGKRWVFFVMICNYLWLFVIICHYWWLLMIICDYLW